MEKGEKDMGVDQYVKNFKDMTSRTDTVAKMYQKEKETKQFENLITNDNYADQTIQDRYAT